MKLSIIIPSYNMCGTISRCLETLLETEADPSEFEVIVFDSSSDDSHRVLKSWQADHANLKVIRSESRVLCGTARNRAVKEAQGEYVYCVDIDDRLADKSVLPRILSALDGKDCYYCPFKDLRSGREDIVKVDTVEKLARMPTGVMNKIYKRDLYSDFADTMPEAVAAHFSMIDKVKTVGSFDFVVYEYDNRLENEGAISRTYDFMRSYPNNLLQLALTPEIERAGLREEYIAGTLHNLANMFSLRSVLKNKAVRSAWADRLRSEWMNFTAGFYVH